MTSSTPSQKASPQVEQWANEEQSKLPRFELESTDSAQQRTYLQGARFRLIVVALNAALFLATLEIPIVGTSIVNITSDLGGFDRAPWIASAYLLGYAGFIIIFSKLSDIFGRKLLLLTAIILFTIFSGIAGAAQTLTQLIVFRSLQGLGGGGCYAMSTIMFIELVPEDRYASIVSLASAVLAIALLVGPIVGGAINNSTTWRWVFLINVPVAVPVIAILFWCIPHGFPCHGHSVPSFKARFSKANIARVDFLGGTLLLIATLALVAALEEAGGSFGWRSAFVITLLCVSGVLCLFFLFWERRVTLNRNVMEPVFPWRFAQSRVWMALLLTSTFHGACWSSAIFQLPQRSQVIHGVSAIRAGLELLPFTVSAPIGSIITAILAKKFIPPLYLVMFSSVIQVAGFALLGTVPYTHVEKAYQYGYQVLAGFGCGTNNSLLILMTPFIVQDQDKAIAMGSLTQFRMIGAAIGLSIVNTAMHGFVKSRLSHLVSSNELHDILNSVTAVAALQPQTREAVVSLLAEGYNIQMRILAGLAGIQLLGSFLMWKKKPIRV